MLQLHTQPQKFQGNGSLVIIMRKHCAGLEAVGQMGSNETVLITAAAGGTGQFVVQLAKAAGNHVIATCGGANKVLFRVA